MNYIMDYTIFDNNRIVRSGKIRVSNKMDEIDAKIKLEGYLRKHYVFTNLVIHNCSKDDLSFLEDMFNMKL